MKQRPRQLSLLLIPMTALLGLLFVHTQFVHTNIVSGQPSKVHMFCLKQNEKSFDMATTAVIYYRMQPGGGTTVNFSTLTPDTTNKLTDGATGDTSTGYTLGPTAGMANFNIITGYDFGTPTTITGWQATASANGGGGTVLYASNDGTTWSIVSQVSAIGTGGRLNAISPGGPAINVTYRYYEVSINGGGGAGTASVTMTDTRIFDSAGAIVVPTAIAAPNALTSVTFALADSGSTPNPTLTWVLPTSGTAYTGFNIRRGTTAGGESATPVNGSPLGAGALSFIDMTAVYAGDYYYVIDGLSTGGTVTSSELHIKSMTAAPTSLAVTFGSGQAILSWTNAVGTLGVIAERTVQGANSWAAVATLTTPVTTYTDATVVNGTAYSFRVRNTD